MNIFQFDYVDVTVSFVIMFVNGVAFGIVYHLIRFLLMHVLDRKGN